MRDSQNAFKVTLKFSYNLSLQQHANINIQLKHNKNQGRHMNRKSQKQSNQTEDLYNQINQSKSIKKKIRSEIKTNIKQNNIIIRNSRSEVTLLPTINSSTNAAKLNIRKEKSLMQLSRSLNERINVDRNARIKLGEVTDQYSSKKQMLEKRIQEIKKRNMTRMKELHQFQEKYLKKLNHDYLRDKQIQKGLLEEYQFVLRQEDRAKQTEEYRRAIEAEDWQLILRQKKQLQAKMREYVKRQQNLIRQQNPEQLEKIKKQAESKVDDEKALLAQSKDKMAHQKVKVDAKEIGNQYLQFAKKVKQIPKEKARLKYMDVNLKCIDYESDIMTKIARNTGDLSRYKIYQSKPTQTKNSIFKQKQKGDQGKLPIFEVKEDEETKRHLKQIRTNLKKMEKNK